MVKQRRREVPLLFLPARRAYFAVSPPRCRERNASNLP